MVNVKLVGDEGETWGSFIPGGYAYYQRHQAVASGTLKSLLVCRASNATDVAVKLSIYSESSVAPDLVLASTGAVNTVPNTTWNSFSVSDVPIVGGTYYWLGVITHINEIRRNDMGGTSKYASGDYSTFSFVNNPSGLSDGSRDVAVAGHGIVSSGASVRLIGPGLCGQSPLLSHVL